MTRSEQFIAELTHEAAPTRRVLERVPDEHLGWKPHVKSMALGQLAMHIANLPMGISRLLRDLVAEVPNVPLPLPSATSDIVATLDQSVAFATQTLAEWSDEDLAATWRMTSNGQTLLELPRGLFFRSVMLNHWYHHRGQLVVYLRLLDVPVPSIYGPTADENPFSR